MTIKRFLPILTAITAQLAALALLFGTIQAGWFWFDYAPDLWLKILLQSLFACGLTYLFGLPRWWVLIQIILPAAIVLAINSQTPTWVYPVVFFALLLFFWNSADERVPLYLSNKTTWQALGDLLESEKRQIKFTDLGCGLAGTLTTLAKRFPQHVFVGVETAPFPYLISKFRCKVSGSKNITILRKSLWDMDLSDFQYTYAFLSPEPMSKLYQKITTEMPDSATFISNSFDVLESPAPNNIQLDDKRETVLHIWKLKKRENT